MNKCVNCGVDVEESLQHCPDCGMSLVSETWGDEPLLYEGGPLHKDRVILYGRIGEVTTARYEVKEMIGEGRFAKVYRALDCKQGQEVAIKLFMPEIAWHTQSMKALKKETDRLLQLSHPNIAAVHGFECMGLARFLVMDLVPGRSLGELLKERRFNEASAIRIVAAVCRALQYAHSKGVVHGDINPRNIMISTSNEVIVTDFRIAQVLQKIDAGMVEEMRGDLGSYASPEEINGRSIDVRSDIYSLGACLYELLSGAPPFAGDELQGGKPKKELPPIPGISQSLHAVIFRCLQSKPEDRFQSTKELIQALDRATTPSPADATSEPQQDSAKYQSESRQKRRRLVLGAVFAVLCLLVFYYSALLAWFATRQQTDRIAEPPHVNVSQSSSDEAAQSLDDDRQTGIAPLARADVPNKDEAAAEVNSSDTGAELIAKNNSPLRKAVETAKQATQLMMVEAKKHGSPTYAAELWKEAEQDREQALKFEMDGRDMAALKAYQRAGSKYMKAERTSKEIIALRTKADAAGMSTDLAEATDQNKARVEQTPIIVVPSQPEAILQSPEEKPEATRNIDFPAGNGAARAGQIITVRDGAEMVMIPAGEFKMGSAAEKGGSTDERPQHRVTINAFYMDKYEVTNAKFCMFLNDKESHSGEVSAWFGVKPRNRFIEEQNGQFTPKQGYEDHPVVGVNWNGATAYAKWAGKRLPTEAEWEYACRAGTTTSFNTGDSIGHNDANFSGTDGKDLWDQTAPVGSFSSNEWGLHDMHGNVLEWCNDWYKVDYYRNSPIENPKGPPSGTVRVVRGGSWDSDSENDLRSPYRAYHPPGKAAITIGFRCVQDLE